MIKLDRPLISFDLETTGANAVRDRIIQFGAVKYQPDGRENLNLLINPGVTIKPDAIEVHGITDQDVACKPYFPQVANQILEFIAGCDLYGYNIKRFDMIMLSEEFHRCEINFPDPEALVLDGMILEALLVPRTLEAVYQRRTGKDMPDAHDGLADSKAALDVLLDQVEDIGLPALVDEYHPLEGVTAQQLADLCNMGRTNVDLAGKIYMDEEGITRWSFGKKCKDHPVAADPGFARWVVDNDFPGDTKRHVHPDHERSQGRKTAPHGQPWKN